MNNVENIVGMAQVKLFIPQHKTETRGNANVFGQGSSGVSLPMVANDVYNYI